STTEALKVARVPLAAAAIAVAGTALAVDLDAVKLTSGVFRHGELQHPNTKVTFLKHGKTASVSLLDTDGLISIGTNGKPDAAIKMRGDRSAADEITMIVAGALPSALGAKTGLVANIGIGSGLTSHVLLASESVKQLDTIEIEPLMAQAARLAFMPRVQRTF